MKKLTFLITAAFYYPCHDITAVSDHVGALAEGLARRGHEVHIMHSLDTSVSICGFYPNAFDLKDMVLKEETEHPDVFIHTIRSPLKVVDPLIAYLFGSSPHVNRQFISIIKEAKPDIVHHFSPMFFGHQILQRQGDYLSVYTATDYWLICQCGYLLKNGQQPCDKKNCFLCALRSRKPPQLGRYSRGFKEAVNDIDLILVESTVVKEALSAELNKKIECIPHYLPYQKQNVRESEYSNYFLFTGQLETRKGILNLLETFRRYSNKIDAKLIITGRGSLEKQIRDFIVKHSLQSKILFLGWVNREVLWSLYKGALAVIVPSIVPDPGPMVVVEALSVGTPVIGSYQAGYIRDVISKVDNGLAFNGGDVESLGKLLIHFRKEDYPPKKVKDICLKWFSVERYVSRYLDVLDNMMATN